MVSKEENGTVSLWLLWGGWALLDNTANRVVSEDTAVVLQEGDGTGAPIRVEVKGKKKKKRKDLHSGECKEQKVWAGSSRWAIMGDDVR